MGSALTFCESSYFFVFDLLVAVLPAGFLGVTAFFAAGFFFADVDFFAGFFAGVLAAAGFFGAFARVAATAALSSALRSATEMVVADLRRRSRP